MRKSIRLLSVAITILLCNTTNAQQWEKISTSQNVFDVAINKTSAHKSIFATSSNSNSVLPRYFEHYRKLKTTGIALTGVGVGCFVGGIALIAEGARRNNDYFPDSSSGPGDYMIVAGTVGIFGSLFALGGGITMWAIGGHHLKKMKQFSFQTKGNRIGLVYKF
jgi:hypothetical protein